MKARQFHIWIKRVLHLSICLAILNCNSMKNNLEKEQDVSAEVIFMAATGHNPLDYIITSENITQYLPDLDNINSIESYFKDNNIHFKYYQGISATISAKKSVLENLFGIKLIPMNKHFEIKNRANSFEIPTDKLPEKIKIHISKIALPSIVETF